jgi:hypothetical protein
MTKLREFGELRSKLMKGFETASEAGGMLAKIVISEPGWLGEAATQIVYPPIGDFMPRS